jgi:predicted MPP superfamily phosphohydrolase
MHHGTESLGMMREEVRKITGHRLRGQLTRAITRPPFRDKLGHKGWLKQISRAQRHFVRRLHLEIVGWSRPLRIAFLSDFHTGSHSDDVVRLNTIVDEAKSVTPDLVLFGGDYVNMQLFGGGRVPPRTIAATIVLAHDPVWFAHLPAGPHFMLAGHTHGGQIRLPGVGIVRNATRAPLRGSHGLIEEKGQYLYVTSGIGTSGVPVRWGVPPEFAVLDVIGKERGQ